MQKSIKTLLVLFCFFFIISHIPLFLSLSSNKTDQTNRQLEAVMSFGWFGMFPVLGLSLFCPIYAIFRWKKLNTQSRMIALLMPLILLAAYTIISGIPLTIWVNM
ncbi:MAG: hypothetical protein JSV30_00470 [Candidatus Omnitrophota bacterium]|nr:MAG: hypothetical protein JSV30_00470 [Candidatus Omnitrophota bacterium]